MSRCRRPHPSSFVGVAGMNNKRNCGYARPRNTRWRDACRVPKNARRSGRYKASSWLLRQVISHVYEDFLLHPIRLKIRFLDQVQRFLG